MATITLKGSERVALTGAREVAPADPSERLEVTVLVRRRAGEELSKRVAQLAQPGAGGAPILSREEFAQQHGADPAALAKVRAFAAAHGLTVVAEHAARRTVILSGTVAQFCPAFNVQLKQMHHDSCSYRGRTGTIELPVALSGVVEAVLGLDNRPQSATHFRMRPASSVAISFTPPQVASLYAFPAGTGAGQCVALIELGGGFRPADLDAYFNSLGLATPTITAVSVDHALNAPTGSANGPDGEVMLDIEVVGSIAPQARIVVYFAPNTDAGFLDAITTAIHDSSNKPSVISISWGGSESTWTAQAMMAMDSAFQAAASLGVTVCVASGDNGSSDGVSDGGDHVDFPASSSYALACGGTSLTAASSGIPAEVVWNNGASGGASGGGISSVFAKPVWQESLSAVDKGSPVALTQRGVPDVSGNADPQTGYNVRVDGVDSVIGGTSAVAPLWAALIARINQSTGKSAGFVNPQLYQNPQALRDITSGNNGDFSAAAGWDACSGLGSPNGAALSAII